MSYKKIRIDDLKLLLETPKHIVLIPHSRPDPDALGSVLALNHIFKNIHTIKIIAPTPYPAFLKWMPGEDQIIIHRKNQNHNLCQKYIKDADLIFCVDFSNTSRLEGLEAIVNEERNKDKIVNIDHHENPVDFADFLYLNPKASASAELVYYFTHDINFQDKIDVTYYELIYAGIMVDTGSFKFKSTTSQVHDIASKAIQAGTNTNKIHRNIYDSYSLGRIKMLGYILSEKLVFIEKYKTTYFSLSEQEQIKFSSQIGDTEGFVNYGLSLKGTQLAVILIQRDNHVKFSFRSVDNLDVSNFAKLYFNGGGHKNASAGKLNISLDEAINYFQEKLELYLKDYFTNNI